MRPSAAPVTIAYITGDPGYQTVGTALTYFSNADPTACPMNTCTLQNSNSDIIFGAGATVWRVEAKKAQWIPLTLSTITMTCTTGGSLPATKTSNPFSVQFLGVDCTQKLVPKALSSFPQIPYVPFSSTSTPLGDWTDFFTNSDLLACPISQCRLFQHSSEFS